MSFPDFLANGFSVDNSKYNIKSEGNAAKKQDKAICKKIASVWEKFTKNSAILLGSSAFLGAVGLAALGVVMISNPITAPIAIAAALAVTAYVAWNVFLAVRTGQANFQASAWKNSSEAAPGQQPQVKKVSEEVNHSEVRKKQMQEQIKDEKEAFIAQIAHAYYQGLDYVNAFDATKQLSSDGIKKDEKEALLEKIALAYIEKGDCKKALEVVEEISSHGFKKDEKEALLVKIANAYYEKADYNKRIRNGQFDEAKNEILTLYNGELYSALRVIRKISSSGSRKEEKEVLFEKIAQAFYEQQDYVNAFNTTKEISSHGSKKDEKEALLEKIAKAYIEEEGDNKKALEVVGEISSNESLDRLSRLIT
jgi:hypothetical protein